MFLHHNPDAFQSSSTASTNINIIKTTPGGKEEVSSLDDITPDGSQNENNDITPGADDVDDGSFICNAEMYEEYQGWYIYI